MNEVNVLINNGFNCENQLQEVRISPLGDLCGKGSRNTNGKLKIQ